MYMEKEKKGNRYRNEYLESIECFIVRERKKADAKRAAYMKNIADKKEKVRKDYLKMLGFPLAISTKSQPLPIYDASFVATDELSSIYRLQMTVLGGVKAYGMLFIPHHVGKIPIVIAQHGGLGTPEVCANFFGSGNYNDIIRRFLRKGVAVFAPQLLLWKQRQFGKSYDRVHIDAQLKQLGGSITALEVYCIQRWIDYLFSREDLDCEKLGMSGLSYGGFYTMFTSAADLRIKAVYSSCFFNDRYVYDWVDWTWKGAALKFLDPEVGALICPRPLYIEIGKKDDLFHEKHAQDAFCKLKTYYKNENAEDLLECNVFGGGHEYDKSDEGIAFLLRHMGVSE